jgi:hypothetical protein
MQAASPIEQPSWFREFWQSGIDSDIVTHALMHAASPIEQPSWFREFWQSGIDSDIVTHAIMHAASPIEQARWFREFWQSAAPKVGEPGATGFGQWVAERHGAPVATSLDDILAQPPVVASGGWSGWLGEVEAEDKAAVKSGAVLSGEGGEEDVATAEGLEGSEEGSEEGSDLEAGALPEEGDEAVDEVSPLLYPPWAVM